MEMKELMRQELHCGDSVNILLKNGHEISGVVEFMGNDLFQLMLSTGISQAMTYDIVGTYQVTRCAQLDTGFENSTISLADLQQRLKASNAEIYKSLMPKLDSLENAIRIKEVTAKFGRTPGILTVLINQIARAPGNEHLLALIGEVALMTEEKKYCLDALSCFDKNWSKSCFASTNLLRILVRLSNLAENYECLRVHIARCPNEHYSQASNTLLYLMDLLDIHVNFPVRNKLDDGDTLARLIHLVDGFLAEQAGAPSPPNPPVTVTLEPLQAVGTIFFYNESLRFGELKDEDNISYRFMLNNVNADARNQLQPGTQVLFFRTTVYSYKFQRNVGAADRITLLPHNALIKYPPPEQRFTGYIILYMQYRRSGYIILEEDYGIKTKGDVFFEIGDIIGNAFLDTRKNHYKVSFSYVNQADSTYGPKRANNIQILDRIPLEEGSQSNHGSLVPKSEDIDKLEITPGETLMVRDIANKLYLGDFVSRDDSRLVIQTQGQNRIFPYWDIKELMFFGLITSYNLLNETGMINGNYPFRSTNVTSIELSHLLRQNKYSTFLCMYSLLAADNNLYINNVDYLSDGMARQLVWRSGKIRGDYQTRNYLSVEDQFRCYISSVKDSTLLNQFNPPESMAFMLQDVFYKVVRHKPIDRTENKSLLVQSVLDIRVKYQQGKVSFHPSNPNSQKIQSGSYSYQCEQDLSECENGTLGKLRLKLSDDNELVADYFDARDLQLPNFYDGQSNDDQSSHTQMYEDDVFDSDLQLSNKKVMALLEFSRDSFDYSRIRGYLPDYYAQMIQDGQFTGNLSEGKTLIHALRNYKPTGRKSSKKENWVDRIPPELRPELILAAAKIHHQLCSENVADKFFSEENSTNILVNYAWHHLTTGLVTEPAEVEYFSEIIFLNNFPSKTKNQMQARCLAEYFVGVKNTNLISYGDRTNILALLRRECTSVSGLSQMLMNLPQDTFLDLLDCIKSMKGHELLIDIAATVSGDNARENHAGESEADNCSEIIRTYYHAFNRKKLQFAHYISEKVSINDVPIMLSQIEEAEQGLGRYLFDDDRSKLERIRKIVNNISDTLMNENVVTQTAQLETAFGQLRNVVMDIEAQPSKFSFEVLRTFARSLQNALVGYLNQQYLLYQPKLRIEHYSLSGDFRRETFCVSNAAHCLSAHNIRVQSAVPYGDSPGFVVDLEGNRQITGEGKSIAGGKGIEISIPIDVFDVKEKESLALSVRVSYERNTIFNPDISIPETEIQYLQEVNLQISLTSDDDAPLTSDDNPYRAYAGGKDMKPDDAKAEKMFFGRQADIEKVYEMLVDDQGRLSSGSIVAIYGQKRCGKTSVMNFLGKRIQEHFPDALILSVNAQNVTREDMYKGLLGEICVEFRRCWRRRPALKAELKEAGLEIPSAGTMFSPGGESIFNAFFREFRAEFQNRYPIVLMVDEYTQAYILMKTGELSGDFLNRWRAMIQSNEFVNVVVGQDFMEKFTTDESITRLNYGGSVNGLGTMGRKRLSYLDFDSAREMMVEPIRNPNGTSRYQDILGEEAIKRIYDLTGGSAFYLMKFCNALVNYMIENNERLVYTSLVETVADSYVFDTPDNPITKTDFDPIYNAYSYDALSESTVIENMDEHAQEEMDKSYQMLKNIADSSNRLGVCNTGSIKWEDTAEKYRILQTLRIRGVLCDANGEEIKSENMENINVKIKVGLFSIWLKKRG